jgi:hypothetical protein
MNVMGAHAYEPVTQAARTAQARLAATGCDAEEREVEGRGHTHLGQLELHGAARRQHTHVAGERLVRVYTVIDGALHVLQHLCTC